MFLQLRIMPGLGEALYQRGIQKGIQVSKKDIVINMYELEIDNKI